MSSEVRLYDATTIDRLAWPNSEVAAWAKAYWVPLMKAGSAHFIDNVESELLLLAIDQLVLPVTVNDRQRNNSYVCSPYSHYITYSQEELYTLNNPWLEQGLNLLLNYLGIILQAGKIDRVVMVNNWLLSTNLYPELSQEQIIKITAYLKVHFPTHALIFRSINTFFDDDLFNAFQTSGYRMIGSRQIYLFNPQDPSSLRTKMRWRLKQDFKLIQQQGYEVIEGDQISSEDVPRLVELYNYLYLEKYSYNNPQFNENFLMIALQQKTFHLQALVKDGKIDGVVGFYLLNGVMTTPILGYDTCLPQSVGLYRMLSVQLTQEATKRGLILHQSSGAASFKRWRGFVPNIEYSAVYGQHLPFWRQWIWRVLQFLVNQLAIPLMKKYKL